MKTVASCLVGFVLGWGARSVLDSFRDALVSVTAVAHGAAEAARRHAGFEREYIEDLLAEGKARWEAERRRRAEGEPAKRGPAATPSSGEGSP